MKYAELASDEVIERTVAALVNRNFSSVVVESREEALAAVKDLLPLDVSVMNGASKTLQEIGFVDYLKSGEHNYNNLHVPILQEQDAGKQNSLRKQATISDYYLGSVNALSETGELLIASNTGSQLPGIAFNSQNLIFVVGSQKIVPTLMDAVKRLEEYVIPLENERMLGTYGMPTTWAKTLVLHKEPPAMGRTVMVVIVKELLGF